MITDKTIIDAIKKDKWINVDGESIDISKMTTSHIENALTMCGNTIYAARGYATEYIPLLRNELEMRGA